MKNLFVAIFSFIFLLSYSQEEPCIKYVCPGYYNSIQAALDDIEPDDTPCYIFVCPGTYYENIVWPGIDDIKCIGINGTPVINGQNQSRPTVSFGSGLTSLTILRNFIITGGTGNYYPHLDLTVGGGIVIEGLHSPSSPSLWDLEIYGNEAGIGGGVWIGTVSDPSLWNCKIYENSAQYGGGIGFGEIGLNWMAFSNASIRKTEISNNTARYGGGIYVYNSPQCAILMDRCLVNDNNAVRHGGGIYIYNGADITILSSIFSNNDAGGLSSTGHAGGIYAWLDPSTGSGINIEIENCTFADNSSTYTYGAAIYCDGSFDVSIMSSVFWDNFAAGFPYNIAGNANYTVQYSNIEDGYPGTGNIEEVPLFIPGDCCDYELDEYSPCIDVGNPGEVLYTHDYCGNNRVIKGNSAYRVDMGAFEYGDGGGSSHGFKNAGIEKESDMGYFIQNHPNPASSYTNFNYSVPEDTYVSINIYNIKGQLIKSLVNEYKNAGSYTVKWNTKDEKGIELLKGMYLYRFETPRHTQTQKLIIN